MYNDDHNEIFTVVELADILKIGLNKAYTLINSGEIESFRINNSHRIQRSAITEYIIRNSKRVKREDEISEHEAHELNSE